MMKRVYFLMLVFIFIALRLNAEEISLPRKNEEIYAYSAKKTFNLKLKLKPKVVDSRVYWQGKEKISWDEEIENWKMGLLSDGIIPPIIIERENFYPEEEDFSGKHFWGQNNMKLLVFNPLNALVRTQLNFYAGSYKRDRNLHIRVNGNLLSEFKVVKSEDENKYSYFEIKNIFLKPGMNEIRFFSPRGRDVLKPKRWEKEKSKRQVSIKFKGFKFSEVNITEAQVRKDSVSDLKCIPQNGFLDILFFDNKPIILSRVTDINLEEFPVFNFSAELIKGENIKLSAYLGVDYSNDGLIDDYIELDYSGEHNLFELAKDRWREINGYKDNFVVKKIFILIKSEDEVRVKDKEKEFNVLRLRNVDFHNSDSLIIRKRKFGLSELKVEKINVKSVESEEKDKIGFLVYPDIPKESKKAISAELNIYVPLASWDLKKFPYFSFDYYLENPQTQEIALAVSVVKKGKKRIIELSEAEYTKSRDKIEINFNNINERKENIKDLIIILKPKEAGDFNKEAQRGYQFQLGKLTLYEKFPYPLKSEDVRKRFLSLISEINPNLVQIDNNEFYLSDFDNWKNPEDLERGVLVRRVQISSGKHKYEKLQNPTFDIEWTILEPVDREQVSEAIQEPRITFKKINPTKYLVKVEKAEEPFWLVFSESFHKQWRLYQMPNIDRQMVEFKEIVADYPKLGVKEARHLMRLTPEDIRYLFRKPLDASHQLVNGYANGWYVEPKKLGLGEDFTLVLYFWPQSLFYLGLMISGATFIGCIGYLGYSGLRKKKVTRNS